MDPKFMIAVAAGISGDNLKRWAEVPDVERTADEDDIVFYLEGPIVESDIENHFGGDATGFVTPNMLRSFLKENKEKDIEININSPGGSVFAANTMISDLMQHEGQITVRISGACFSAAADFLCIPDSLRIAMPGSMVMIHNAWTIAAGDSKQLSKVVSRLDKMNEMCADRFADHTNLTKDDLRQMMDDETWFSDREALEDGFVDELYGVDEEIENEENEEESEVDVEEAARSVERANTAVSHRLAIIL